MITGGRRRRCIREQIIKSTSLRIYEIGVLRATDRMFFYDNSTHGNVIRDFIQEGFHEPFCQ
jgi:hypothetical protein